MHIKNATALICCFARCYHYKNNKFRILNDNIAEKILSKEEYNEIASNMTKGIQFFNPNFKGSNEEALRWIVDNQLSPSVLGRSAFCEKSLENAIRLGCKQYLQFASGYDTFAYRKNIENLQIFEIDRNEMIKDKIKRLEKNQIDHSKVHFINCDFSDKNWIKSIEKSSYNRNEISFNSLLGITYYLTKEEFEEMIQKISKIIKVGSSIVFDYPTNEKSKEMKINQQLAEEAKEKMKSNYSYQEIENILANNGLLIYEHLNNEEMTQQYFENFNTLNPNHKIIAPKGVAYCLAVKK